MGGGSERGRWEVGRAVKGGGKGKGRGQREGGESGVGGGDREGEETEWEREGGRGEFLCLWESNSCGWCPM